MMMKMMMMMINKLRKFPFFVSMAMLSYNRCMYQFDHK